MEKSLSQGLMMGRAQDTHGNVWGTKLEQLVQLPDQAGPRNPP